MKQSLNIIAFIITFAFIQGLTPVLADSYTFKRGQDQYHDFKCTDATTREDGSRLCGPADTDCENEIAEVILYVDQTVGEVTAPATSVSLAGGCYGKAMRVNLYDYPIKTVLHVYGVTVDFDGNTSVVSVDNSDFIINAANPGAPGQIKKP